MLKSSVEALITWFNYQDYWPYMKLEGERRGLIVLDLNMTRSKVVSGTVLPLRTSQINQHYLITITITLGVSFFFFCPDTAFVLSSFAGACVHMLSSVLSFGSI